MPRLRPTPDDESLSNTDRRVSGLSPLLLSLATNEVSYAAHAPLQSRLRHELPSTFCSDHLDAPRSHDSPILSQKRRRKCVRSLPTPESSPERPSQKRKASAKETEKSSSAYLTPPASDDEQELSDGTVASSSDQSLDFPLNPWPLPNRYSSKNSIAHNEDQVHRRRLFSNGIRRLTPKPSTDRFISNRTSAYDLSHTFRSTKATQDLTRSEKLLRGSSASPDPFGRLILPRLREQSAVSSRSRQGLVRANRNRSRTIGAVNAIALPEETSAPQNRQVSAGAVWNVGGNTSTTQLGPVRAISNGRGGFLSSGSNAPMYTAEFLDEHTQDQEMETMENRIARALEIDRTERLISTVRSLGELRSASTGSIGLKRNSAPEGPKTTWINGEWVRSCSSRTWMFLLAFNLR